MLTISLLKGVWNRWNQCFSTKIAILKDQVLDLSCYTTLKSFVFLIPLLSVFFSSSPLANLHPSAENFACHTRQRFVLSQQGNCTFCVSFFFLLSDNLFSPFKAPKYTIERDWIERGRSTHYFFLTVLLFLSIFFFSTLVASQSTNCLIGYRLFCSEWEALDMFNSVGKMKYKLRLSGKFSSSFVIN